MKVWSSYRGIFDFEKRNKDGSSRPPDRSFFLKSDYPN